MPVEAESKLDISEVERRKAVLKVWRDKKSAEMGQPRYCVLQNKTLAEIASRDPKTVEDLQTIYGIGEGKAQKYGAEILGML